MERQVKDSKVISQKELIKAIGYKKANYTHIKNILTDIRLKPYEKYIGIWIYLYALATGVGIQSVDFYFDRFGCRIKSKVLINQILCKLNKLGYIERYKHKFHKGHWEIRNCLPEKNYEICVIDWDLIKCYLSQEDNFFTTSSYPDLFTYFLIRIHIFKYKKNILFFEKLCSDFPLYKENTMVKSCKSLYDNGFIVLLQCKGKLKVSLIEFSKNFENIKYLHEIGNCPELKYIDNPLEITESFDSVEEEELEGEL